MEDIVISKGGFKTNDNIKIREEFHHAFGIINEADTTPQKIIFSLSQEQGQYLKNYPLHHSQQTVSETPDKIVLELNLLITFDFVMELMSFGPILKVISPKSLIKLLVNNSKKVIKIYEK